MKYLSPLVENIHQLPYAWMLMQRKQPNATGDAICHDLLIQEHNTIKRLKL